MEQLIATLFLAREISHREHLRDFSYAQHMALADFYDEIVDLADEIAETVQDETDLGEIPILANTVPGTIIDILRSHRDWIRENRYKVCPREETEIQNLIDEVVALYRRTIFKLRRLK